MYHVLKLLFTVFIYLPLFYIVTATIWLINLILFFKVYSKEEFLLNDKPFVPSSSKYITVKYYYNPYLWYINSDDCVRKETIKNPEDISY